MSRITTVALLTTLILAGCHSTRPPDGKKQVGLAAGNTLPEFVAVDSEGKQVKSSQVANKAVVLAFFDPGSVLAWRTLVKLNEARTKGDSIVFLAVAGSKEGTPTSEGIDALKRQYQIGFAVLIDSDNKLLNTFQVQSCCDHLNTYDAQGTMRASAKLNESYDQIGALIEDLNHAAFGTPTTTPNLKEADLYSSLKVHPAEGVSQPVAVAAGAPTIVNLFEEFCTECSTGSRWDTLTRLEKSPGGPGHVLAIFSDKKFSVGDMDNFRKILPVSFSLETGNIEAATPYLIKGRLLVIFDSKKNLVWQERPDMTEQEIITETSKLLGSSVQ